MKKYDAIVIGAGHNGLTNGAYLAKAGLDVLVLERNSYIGGATVSRELHKDWTYSNIDYMRKELNTLGLSFSKTREFATCDELYTKWEQEFIIKMFEEKLLYRESTTVNWCEDCQTVLANEQVEAGLCWRCGEQVRQKKLWQWFFRITDYAEDLLSYCEKLPG